MKIDLGKICYWFEAKQIMSINFGEYKAKSQKICLKKGDSFKAFEITLKFCIVDLFDQEH
jgi:hypothetical protein